MRSILVLFLLMITASISATPYFGIQAGSPLDDVTQKGLQTRASFGFELVANPMRYLLEFAYRPKAHFYDSVAGQTNRIKLTLAERFEVVTGVGYRAGKIQLSALGGITDASIDSSLPETQQGPFTPDAQERNATLPVIIFRVGYHYNSHIVFNVSINHMMGSDGQVERQDGNPVLTNSAFPQLTTIMAGIAIHFHAQKWR